MKSVTNAEFGPGSSEYEAVVHKRFNKRFTAQPEYVCLIDSTEQAVDAVQRAVSERRRLVVTTGGHCLEGFVADPEVQVIVDVSPMKRVYFDADRRAIAVEAGANSVSRPTISTASRWSPSARIDAREA